MVLSPREQQKFIAILWAIWLHRNNIVFRNMNDNLVSILLRKDALLKDLGEAAETKKKQFPVTHNESRAHLEVEFGTDNNRSEKCIVLVDGAWKKSKQHFARAGIGWSTSLRNTKTFEGNATVLALSPLQTEALAMLKGIRTAYNKGFRNIQISTDSSELVRATTNIYQPFEISTIVHDITSIRSKFNFCRIRKVSRQEIVPAHELAITTRAGKLVN